MLKEFSHTKYGKVHTNIIDSKPYLNYQDVAAVFEIKNRNKLRAKINGNYFKELPDNTNGKITKIYYVSFECLKLVLCNSRKKEADEVFAWLINTVKDRLIKLNKRDQELLEQARSKNITKEHEYQIQENKRLHMKLQNYISFGELIRSLIGNKKVVALDKVVKLLNFKNLKPETFYRVLREHKIIDKENLATQEFCDKEMFRVIEVKTEIEGTNIVFKYPFYICYSFFVYEGRF